MKTILLLLLFGLNANAQLANYTVKIFDLTNPSGADQFSKVQDITTKGGYSIQCIVTGTLSFTGTILVSNQNDVKPVLQQFVSVSGTAQTINNTGYMYDIVQSNVGWVKLKIGTFTGTGTAKCYFTAKHI